MATIFGSKGKTQGEQIVYKQLSTLPDEWIIYSQPTIVSDSTNRYPDFVIIHEDIGVLVLEVKDWVIVTECDDKRAKVRRTHNSVEEWDESPVEQAKNACYTIQDELVKYNELLDSASKLSFPWRFAGILPKFYPDQINQLRPIWGRYHLFGSLDIEDRNIELTLRSVPAPFSRSLSRRQIDIIRSVIDTSLKVGANGIYDLQQEMLAKEEFKRKELQEMTLERIQLSLDMPTRIGKLEENLPEEIVDSSKTESVRLVRGTAGTGKTDVILLRCHYLKEQHPDLSILVTTHNVPISETRFRPVIEKLAPTINFKRFGQICQDVFREKYSTYIDPQGTEGLVRAILERESRFSSLNEEFGPEFLAEEVQWMKETDLTSKESYLTTVREGRGGVKGRSLSKSQKDKIFDFFSTYEDYLDGLGTIDWNDFYDRALSIVQEGKMNYQKFDEILIDEAQHFAPKWIKLLIFLLKDNGTLFLCEDPSQSVFRSFSWKQKGVKVQGRTKWLRIPYRSTRQILQAAYSLIVDNQSVLNQLKETGDFEIPDLNSQWLRDGSIPELHRFETWGGQREFIKEKIFRLIESGYQASEIAILHTKSYVLDPFEELKGIGVIVDEVKRETGMEYKVIFLPKLSDFLKKNSVDEKMGVEINQSNLYTAITRAKDLAYLFVEKKTPRELEPLLEHVQIFTH